MTLWNQRGSTSTKRRRRRGRLALPWWLLGRESGELFWGAPTAIGSA